MEKRNYLKPAITNYEAIAHNMFAGSAQPTAINVNPEVSVTYGLSKSNTKPGAIVGW